MQIKITMKYYYICIRMTKIEQTVPGTGKNVEYLYIVGRNAK